MTQTGLPLSTFASMGKKLRLFDNSSRLIRQQSVLTDAAQRTAMQEIGSWPEARPTPLLRLQSLAKQSGLGAIWYKDESSRFGLGSFKALGGAYAVLRVLQKEVFRQTGNWPSSKELRGNSFATITRKVTVTTATDGNHGRSVAWGAQMFGCQCVVYVPAACSHTREAAIARYGAKVARTKSRYDDAVRTCARDAAEYGFVVVSDTSWLDYVEIPLDIMLGYMLMTEEVLNQLPASDRFTHVFVQAGVGGLAASVCAHLSNRLGESTPMVIVVEPEGAACLFASARAGRPVPAQAPASTIMAGLDCAEVSILAWEILSRGVTAFVTVPDAIVAPCIKLLAAPAKGESAIVAGESAVAGLAALLICTSDAHLRNKLKLDSMSQVLVFGTEGDTDPEIYQSLLRSPDQP